MTSWRSGRLERSHLGRGRDRGPGRRVPKTERADGAGAGVRACGYGPEDQDCIGSSNSNTTASEVRGHHTQRRRAARERRPDPVRFFGITLGSAMSPDASASVTRTRHFGGEFDPGSGSTLAACLMHASRARTLSGVLRGGRVRNTWATCPGVGDSRGKPRVIPHTLRLQPGGARKTLRRRPRRGLRPISWTVG